MLKRFKERCLRPERIDTGDYTPAEYDQFLREIRLVNRYAGDNWALARSLFRDIEQEDLTGFSVLDIGAGSGEILRTCARFARRSDRSSMLCGLELNPRSSKAMVEESSRYREISSVQADAFELPFDDGSFDYVICSLFTHHFAEKEISVILSNMTRVARRKIFVIDLHRHPAAYVLYKVFCLLLIRGSLVKADGLLSILRSFKPYELERLAKEAELSGSKVRRNFPFRLVLEANAKK